MSLKHSDWQGQRIADQYQTQAMEDLRKRRKKDGKKVNMKEKNSFKKAQILELLLEKTTALAIMKEQCGRNNRTKVQRQ